MAKKVALKPDEALHVHEFRCWADFVAAACAAQDAFGTSGNADGSHYAHGGSWHGSRNWDEAVSFALKGWRAGRERMIAARAPRARPKISVYRSQSFDVAGAYPNIGMALGGDPECMVNHGATEISSRPVIAIDVDLAAHDLCVSHTK